MNLRMYPVPSNSSRRLRRSIVPAVYAAGGSRSRSADLDQGSSARTSYQLDAELLISHPNYLNQSDREMLLRQRAMDQAQQGQLAAAIDLFTQLIRSNPNSASNFNNRGLLHFQNGQPLQALADYNRALLLNPRQPKVYNNRANCYAALGELESAIADYETAIDLDPANIRARLNLGITLRQVEDYDQAIENFDLALQIIQFLNSADTVSISTALEGHLFAERGRTYHLFGDWNYAIADYHRALARLPLAGSASDLPHRLRLQVKEWLNDLLAPLQTD